MCYICRRVYHELEGWDWEWSCGEARPPSPAEAARVPCSFVRQLDQEVREVLWKGQRWELTSEGQRQHDSSH